MGKVGLHLLSGLSPTQPLGLSSLPENQNSGTSIIPFQHLMASLHLCRGLTAFDLALLRVCWDKEGLSEEPEDVDQPEKRQESKSA